MDIYPLCKVKNFMEIKITNHRSEHLEKSNHLKIYLPVTKMCKLTTISKISQKTLSHALL